MTDAPEWTPTMLLDDPDADLFWCCARCERPNFVRTEPRCGQCGRPPRELRDRLRVALAGRPSPDDLAALEAALVAADAHPCKDADEVFRERLAALEAKAARLATAARCLRLTLAAAS